MTDKYAVIGNPIAHSKSPEIHTMFAEQFKGMSAGDMVYQDRILAPLEEDGFKAKIFQLRDAGYKGCNVTVPFKFEAFKLAAVHKLHAGIAQAVNTLKFEGDTIIGNNTDGIGLHRDIQFNLGITLKNKRVLLIGAGGAANGVALPLGHAGAKITIVNRTVDKAQALATRTSDNSEALVISHTYTEIVGQQFDVVINATSTGLSDEMPPLHPGLFATGALAYDMMYGRETPFMKFAREQGAAIVSDGLGMLVEQAAESFFFWRGAYPRTAPVIAALRNAQ